MSDPKVTALDLPTEDPLPEGVQRYYEVCEEKLGMVPNVLRAYGFSQDRLNGFSAMYNSLMLGESELSQSAFPLKTIVFIALLRTARPFVS